MSYNSQRIPTRGAVQFSLGNTAPYVLTASRIAALSFGRRYTGASGSCGAAELRVSISCLRAASYRYWDNSPAVLGEEDGLGVDPLCERGALPGFL